MPGDCGSGSVVDGVTGGAVVRNRRGVGGGLRKEQRGAKISFLYTTAYCLRTRAFSMQHGVKI